LAVALGGLAVSCGGGDGRPQWEKALVALVCSADGDTDDAVYARPPFVVESSAAGINVTVEGAEPKGRVTCETPGLGDEIAIDDLRLLGVLPPTAGDDSRFVAVARSDASSRFGWLRVADDVRGDSSLDWTSVPVVEYSSAQATNADLEIAFVPGGYGEAYASGLVPCTTPGQRLIVPATLRVEVTNRGPGVVDRGLRIGVDDVTHALSFRRPMQPLESFSFPAVSGARVVVSHDSEAVRPKYPLPGGGYTSAPLRVPEAGKIELVCKTP
jgi:hypothetical protein